MKKINCIFVVLSIFAFSIEAQDTSNTIGRGDFNFGHQLGYLYSRTYSAYFKPKGNWSFETGLMEYYTSDMPGVRNEKWKERHLLVVPLGVIVSLCENVIVRFNSDLIAEFPLKKGYPINHSLGGNSPRFRTVMRLLKEKKNIPATALTVGVKFSSAKPYVIWEKNHNFDQSNGLSGAGTGIADYFFLFVFSKRLNKNNFFHSRIGLAPLGDPTSDRTAQSDAILWAFAWEKNLNTKWSLKNEFSGMYGALDCLKWDTYAVFRSNINYHMKKKLITLNIERGLTKESDEWVIGFYLKFDFLPVKK